MIVSEIFNTNHIRRWSDKDDSTDIYGNGYTD